MTAAKAADRSIDPATGTYWSANKPEYWDIAAEAWRNHQTFTVEQAERRDSEIARCETRAAVLRADAK